VSVSGRGAPLKAARAGVLRPLGGVCARTLRRLGPARVAAVLLAAAVLGAAWLWFRDSSLVSVRQVAVTGVSGPDSGRIRAALVAAAHTMTTLDVQRSRLRTAVAPYPAVKSLRVTADFPHGLRIHVIEELPSAILSAGGRRIVVAADGAVLRGATTDRSLPVLPVRALPVGSRVTDRHNHQELTVLGAAPPRLAARVADVLYTPAHGIVVKLRAGPSLYFGASSSLHAKWIAATAVLADPGSAGAAYIDLTDPSRPAAG
jgi:cell division protein FtsQ